jgi:hypothetical protein
MATKQQAADELTSDAHSFRRRILDRRPHAVGAKRRVTYPGYMIAITPNVIFAAIFPY